MQYLATDIAQDYFRTIIARFSKDIFRKQLLMEHNAKSKGTSASPMSVTKTNDDEDVNSSFLSPQEQLLSYKKKMISKHFAHYLTRVVGELIDEGGGRDSFPQLPGSHLALANPALEFVKSVLVVLNLDPDVKQEVIYLKKSLFAQIGVQEYSGETQWKNPAATFVLPDVYCMECHECFDVDLCATPPEDVESSSVSISPQFQSRLMEILERLTCILITYPATDTEAMAMRWM
jgi:DNA polymerase epsilon subunit 1